MCLEKLFHGFVRILTDTGKYYVEPTLADRLRLLWIFRNFTILPQQVLSTRQQRLLNRLCSATPSSPPDEDEQLIGTIVTSVFAWSPCSYERRSNARHAVQFEVRYGMGKPLITGHGCDIGAGGIGLEGPETYPIGSELQIQYRLRPTDKWTKTRVLVRHRDGNRMGAEFLDRKESQRLKMMAVPDEAAELAKRRG